MWICFCKSHNEIVTTFFPKKPAKAVHVPCQGTVLELRYCPSRKEISKAIDKVPNRSILGSQKTPSFRFPLTREQFTAQWSSSKSSSTLAIHFVAKKWEWVIRGNEYISIYYIGVFFAGQLWQLEQYIWFICWAVGNISNISNLIGSGSCMTSAVLRCSESRHFPNKTHRSPALSVTRKKARCRKKKEYPWCWELGCSNTKIFRQTGRFENAEVWPELYETVKANRLIHAKLPYPAFKSPTQPKYCKHQIEYQLHREKERKSEQQKRYRM